KLRSLLKRLFRRMDPSPQAPIADPVLGVIEFNAEQGSWGVELPRGSSSIWLGVSGNDVPHSALLPRAREIASDLEGFIARLKFFVQDHIAHFNGHPEQLAVYRSELER